LQDFPNESVRQALIPLVESAGNDAARARQNIEDWYNSSMDRVSGWYKRRSQVFVFIIGLVAAIALNADSVLVAKRLSTDRALRDSLLSAAQEYAKAHANASPTQSPASGTSNGKPSENPASKPTPTSTPTPETSTAALTS